MCVCVCADADVVLAGLDQDRKTKSRSRKTIVFVASTCVSFFFFHVTSVAPYIMTTVKKSDKRLSYHSASSPEPYQPQRSRLLSDVFD